MLAEGKTVAEVAKALEVSDRAELPPLAQPVRRDEANDVKRLKEHERENSQL